MASTKFEVNKFMGENNFNLWRIKMKAILVRQGLTTTISREELVSMIDTSKATIIQEKALSAILLWLGDEVLREVSEKIIIIKVWLVFEKISRKQTILEKEVIFFAHG